MIIKLSNVYKKFGENIVLENINLSLKKGKIYGFIGRNGSGKTMLFNVICGFVKVNSGNVIINGLDISDKGIFPQNIRALIDRPKFLPFLTGYQNLELLANINNTIGKDEILCSLKEVNLLKHKDKLYSKYSLGMKQKLGIAQVLMENPEIMIFDEPFNGLDDESVGKIRNLLLNLKEQGKLILIATHIKEDIEMLCDEVYKMEDGKIIDNL